MIATRYVICMFDSSQIGTPWYGGMGVWGANRVVLR